MSSDNAESSNPSLPADEAAQSAAVLSLLGFENATDAPDVTSAWKAGVANDPVTVTDAGSALQMPLGFQPDSTPPLMLGPEVGVRGSHGVMVGSTGSGKSTALQFVAFALCARHPPETVQLLLISATAHSVFADFAGYPHVEVTSGALDAEAALLELVSRRSEAAEHGFTARCGERWSAEHVVVIVDEFPELLEQDDEFVDVLDRLLRVGRSLGIRVLLAGQTLGGARGRQLLWNVAYRIALRTETEQCSRDVVGGVEAAHLPPGTCGVGFYCPHPGAAPLPLRVLPTPRSLVRAVGLRLTDR